MGDHGHFPTHGVSVVRRMREPIAYTEVVDGVWRPVYADERGQYVIDDDGMRVSGAWFIPREECDIPIVVSPS